MPNPIFGPYIPKVQKENYKPSARMPTQTSTLKNPIFTRVSHEKVPSTATLPSAITKKGGLRRKRRHKTKRRRQ